MKRKIFALLGIIFIAVALAACNDDGNSDDKSDLDDLTKNVTLRFNVTYGSQQQGMTYYQGDPLTLPDNTTVSSKQLKPMWTYVASQLNAKFEDKANTSVSSSDMIKTASTNDFADEMIYGGNNVGETFMTLGAQGKFINLLDQMELGRLPNFTKYLDNNPDIKKAITAYDGNIYHIPYIAEIGEFARGYTMRNDWVTGLLDGEPTYDESKTLTSYYDGYWIEGSNKGGIRIATNGGTVEPKAGVNVVKKTNQNIITIQNALPTKNGKSLAQALVKYIKDNYDYTNPSELYLGAKAAYDIDELVALWRCIDTNPALLTGNSTNNVHPFFVRQGSYREEVLRLATYFGGIKVHGSDSYGARWYIDNDGELQHTYSQPDLYNVLVELSKLQAEGLFYDDTFNDGKGTTNWRSTLYGKDDDASNKNFGFMTYDFTASTTSDSLNKKKVAGSDEPINTIVGVLPPVGKVNGVWQYYMDNSRVIKPDGWAISVKGCTTEAELLRALSVFDYFFSEEGAIVQNYAMPSLLKTDEKYVGPDGKEYPAYIDWVHAQAKERANGDLSTFLRNFLGVLLPIGYQKEIGFEYQYTSPNGFDAWALLKGSTANLPTYSGEGIAGANKNYYRLIPPVFSLTQKQSDAISTDCTKITSSTAVIYEHMFNIIRYNANSANMPAGTEFPKTVAEFNAMWKDAGIDTYVSAYQAAYKATQ